MNYLKRVKCSVLMLLAFATISNAFSVTNRGATSAYSTSASPNTPAPKPDAALPKARIQGYLDPSDLPDVTAALERAGYDTTILQTNPGQGEQDQVYQYAFVKATGMLKLVQEPLSSSSLFLQQQSPPPRWIPIVTNMENVLVKNGWSFLDPDENDLSPFDIDAANEEGLYRPKWGDNEQDYGNTDPSLLSFLGFDMNAMAENAILEAAATLQKDQTRRVLLEGATDPPNTKQTHNGFDFSGSVRELPEGIFLCAIGGLPLFTTLDISPTTASSGWLSFARPISEDHVILILPTPGSIDQRTEVLCARTRCHLGHYFGVQDGYCINASALNFIASKRDTQNVQNSNSIQVGKKAFSAASFPISWRALQFTVDKANSPSTRLLQEMLRDMAITETIVLGAGCFWHVEAAFRRLLGVIDTQVGYAGGDLTRVPVSYEEVCQGQTAFAEVVQVTFDPRILNPQVLLDCFLALHNPTKVRAHGKHALGTGQYRSCIFVSNDEMLTCAQQAVDECQTHLQKEVSTEVRLMNGGEEWFCRAEDRHQRHDERKKLRDSSISNSNGGRDVSALSAADWLAEYGRRSKSVWGSSETI